MHDIESNAFHLPLLLLHFLNLIFLNTVLMIFSLKKSFRFTKTRF